MECAGRGFGGGGGGCVAAERLAAALARKRSIGAVQDGAGAAAASSQGMGGIGGDDDGFVVVPKTSAQVRPGAGDVGAPGSVSPWPPPSAKESTRVGVCAIDATAFLSEFPALAPRACNQVKKAAAVCLCVWAARTRTADSSVCRAQATRSRLQ